MSQENPPTSEKSLSTLKAELVRDLTLTSSNAWVGEVLLPKIAQLAIDDQQDKIESLLKQYFKIYNTPTDEQDLIKETINLFTQENGEAIVEARKKEVRDKTSVTKPVDKTPKVDVVKKGETVNTELIQKVKRETPLLTQSAERIRNTPLPPKRKILERRGSDYLTTPEETEEYDLSDDASQEFQTKQKGVHKETRARGDKLIDTIFSKAKKSAIEKAREKREVTPEPLSTSPAIEETPEEEEHAVVLPITISHTDTYTTSPVLTPLRTPEPILINATSHTMHTSKEPTKKPETKEKKKNLDQRIDEALREPGVKEKIQKFLANADENGVVAVTHGGTYKIREDLEPQIEGGLSLKKGDKALTAKTDFDGQVTGFLLNQFGIKVNEQQFVKTGTEFDVENEHKGDIYFDVAENGKILSAIEDPKTGKVHITLGNHFEGRDVKTSSADILYRVLKKVVSKKEVLRQSAETSTSYDHLTQKENLDDIDTINKKRESEGLEPFSPADYSAIEKTPLNEKALKELIRFTNDADNLMMPLEIRKKHKKGLSETLYGHYRTLPFQKIIEHFASGKKATDPLAEEILKEEIPLKNGTKSRLENALQNITNAEIGIKNAKKEMTAWSMPEGVEKLGRVLISNEKNKTSKIANKEVVFTSRYNYDSLITINEEGAFVSRPGHNLQELYEKIQAQYPEAILQNSMILYYPEKVSFNEREFLHTLGIDYAETKKEDTEVRHADLKKGLALLDELDHEVSIQSIIKGVVTLIDKNNNTSTEPIDNLLTLINTGEFKIIKEEVESTVAPTEETKPQTAQELVSGIASFAGNITERIQKPDLNWPPEIVEILTVKEIADIAKNNQICMLADREFYKERVRQHKIEKIKNEIEKAYDRLKNKELELVEIRKQIDTYGKRNAPEENEASPENKQLEEYIDFEEIENKLEDPKFLYKVLSDKYTQIGFDKIMELLKIAGVQEKEGISGLTDAYITAKKTNTNSELVNSLEEMLRSLEIKK